LHTHAAARAAPSHRALDSILRFCGGIKWRAGVAKTAENAYREMKTAKMSGGDDDGDEKVASAGGTRRDIAWHQRGMAARRRADIKAGIVATAAGG